MFVRLEADLEDSVTESVAVEWLDRHQTLVVVGHGDEAEAFAFVCLEIPDDFHVLKRYKQLPVRGTAIETDKQSLPPPPISFVYIALQHMWRLKFCNPNQ